MSWYGHTIHCLWPWGHICANLMLMFTASGAPVHRYGERADLDTMYAFTPLYLIKRNLPAGVIWRHETCTRSPMHIDWYTTIVGVCFWHTFNLISPHKHNWIIFLHWNWYVNRETTCDNYVFVLSAGCGHLYGLYSDMIHVRAVVCSSYPE